MKKPTKGHTVTITFTPEEWAMLEVWQFRDSKNREEFVRDMIRDGLYARIRRRQRHALKYTRETAAELAASGNAYSPRQSKIACCTKVRVTYLGRNTPRFVRSMAVKH
jgi:acid stress-induced BolA-like protein IbaG/YrbA